mmetsp:Transcript_10928/g.27527  ORF Transcript_10928/g.27527 Transcript_10928/m.27527 type:complete len:89 (-) Transcript_10928:142-408(-)
MAPLANLRTAPGLVKWWTKYSPVNGMVTRTVSPYRQDVITPWVKKWPAKAQKKVVDNFMDVVPPFLTLIGVVAWGDATYDREVRKHRD